MNDLSVGSAGGLSARAEADARIYRLTQTFWLLAAITVARVIYLTIHPFDLHPDEAQYWVWSRDLAFGYYSKPPVVAWLIAATTAICGNGEACVRVSAPLLHFAAALAIYGVGHRLYDRRIGFWSALIYVTLPGVSFSAVVLSTDAPLLLCWALALYALVRVLQENSWLWWLALGAAVGFGLLSKYAMVFFLLSMALYLILERRAVRASLPGFGARLTVALGLAALIYLPNLLWNATNGFVSYAHTEDNVNLSGDLFRFDTLFEFIGAQFGVFGPILFALLLVILLRWRGWVHDRRRLLLVCFTLPTLALMIGQAFLSRANANWAAPVYVAASVLVTAWAFEGARAAIKGPGGDWRGRALWLSGSVLLHVAAIAALCAFLVATYGRPDALPAKADPFKRVRGWHELGASINLARREFGAMPLLVDERKLMAEVLYYGRPWSAGAVKWRPNRIHDHFDLTRPFVELAPGRMMLVTERQDASAITSRFAHSDILAEIRTPIGVGRERVVRIYLVEGFLGYPSPR
jgi:4-amino-4-deoxy-L-arabinose transferase-like glycosyltransferase